MKSTNTTWGNVNLIHCDVRLWKPLELCDMMVSELLGSWGDNESSPECLSIAQQHLKEGNRTNNTNTDTNNTNTTN